MANMFFRRRISTLDAFPADATENEWALLSWVEACKEVKVKFTASRRILKIVREVCLL